MSGSYRGSNFLSPPTLRRPKVRSAREKPAVMQKSASKSTLMPEVSPHRRKTVAVTAIADTSQQRRASMKATLDLMGVKLAKKYQGSRRLGQQFPDSSLGVGADHRSLSGRHRSNELDALSSRRAHGLQSTQARLFGKFRCIARLVIALFSLWKIHAQKVKEFLDSNVDLIDFDQPTDLLFDVTEYKTQKQAILSQAVKTTLLKRPGDRNKEEVKHLMVALRNYPSLAEYPITMTRKMAEKAWLVRVEKKRVLLMEGHVARTYYFILSGSVVVSKMDPDTGTSRTVCFLHRDESFGELGLINNQCRQASVITKEPSELLMFLEEDFIEIFMAGGIKGADDPFLCNFWIFQMWPLEMLTENPSEAFLSYFKRNTVLSINSCYSDWLYIIKSGSCTILKRLKKITCDNKSGSIIEKPDETVKETEKKGVPELKVDKRSVSFRRKQLRELHLGVATRPIEETIFREKLPLEHFKNHKPLPNFPEVDICIESLTGALEDVEDPTYAPDHDKNQSCESTDESSDCQPFVTKTQLNVHPPTIPEESEPDESLNVSFDDEKEHETVGETTRALKSSKRSSIVSRAGKKLTITDTLNKQYLLELHEPSEDELNPEFVKVTTLTKGAIFGLQDCVHSNQPELSLVSNGAECIVISKRLFLHHATQVLLNKIRYEVSPYPDNKTLQEGLRTYVEWQGYKRLRLKSAQLWNSIKNTDIHDARDFLLKY